MSSTCVILVAAAAMMHAGWNLLSKAKNPCGAFFLLATTASLLLLAPVFLMTAPMLGSIPGKVWLLLLVSGAAETLYYVALAASYRSGEMSIAYPAARSLPTLLIPPATALLGIGGKVSALALAGMALVFLGCALLPLVSFKSLKQLNCGRTTLLFLLLAAASITVYSIVDSVALKLLCAGVPGTGRFKASLFYIAWTNAFILPFLAAYVLTNKIERRELSGFLGKEGLMFPLLCGPICSAGYTFTLLAMLYASNVGYVIAMKQMSIPLGVALGLTLLKERITMPKLAGVGIITAGLVLVAL